MDDVDDFDENDDDEDDEGLSVNEVDAIEHELSAAANDNASPSDVSDMSTSYILFSPHDKSTLGDEMDLETSVERVATKISAPAEANAREIRENLESSMMNLFKMHEFGDTNKIVDQQRLIVTVNKLQELKGSTCTVQLRCGEICKKKLDYSCETKGSVVKLRWTCHNSHLGMWTSSEIISESHSTPIYLNDILITACVFISGNNYTRFAQTCQFLKVAVPDRSVFYRNQRLFITPAVLTMWHDMRSTVIDVLSPYEHILLGGDGRNDSPGFSARFCAYVAMELLTSIVVDLEIIDKRETGGISTNMEREGMKRILLRIMKKLDIGEMTTDASSSIMKQIRELKGMHHFSPTKTICLHLIHF